MKHVDPTYLLLVVTRLADGSPRGRNLSALSNGLTCFFSNLFPIEMDAKDRQFLLEVFTFRALMKREVGAGFASRVLGVDTEGTMGFLRKYSK